MAATKPTSRSTASSRRSASVRGQRSDGVKKELLVEQAARLFDSNGYNTTSVEEIAEAAGIRKPTLYHYFRSKDEILFALHEEFIDLLLERQVARAETSLAPSYVLLEIMADVLELMETHRGYVRVFFEHHRELPPAARRTISGKRDRYEEMVEQVIQDAIDQGEFRPVDTKLATFALFGMCNWAYQWYQSNGPLRSREIAYFFWEILLNGIAVR